MSGDARGLRSYTFCIRILISPKFTEITFFGNLIFLKLQIDNA